MSLNKTAPVNIGGPIIKSDIRTSHRTRRRRSAPVLMWTDCAKFRQERKEDLQYVGHLPHSDVPMHIGSKVHYTGVRAKARDLSCGLTQEQENDLLWTGPQEQKYRRTKMPNQGPFEPRDIRNMPHSYKYAEGHFESNCVGQRAPSRVRQQVWKERFGPEYGTKDRHAQILIHGVGMTQDFRPYLTREEQKEQMDDAIEYGKDFGFKDYKKKKFRNPTELLMYADSLSYHPPQLKFNKPAGVHSNDILNCDMYQEQMKWNWQWSNSRYKERGTAKYWMV